MATYHHDLKLVQAHPCYFCDTRMTKLMKPNVTTQSNDFTGPPDSLCDAVWGHGKQASLYPPEPALAAPQRVW